MPRRGRLVHIEIDDARLTTAAQTEEAAPIGSGLDVEIGVYLSTCTTPAKAGVQLSDDRRVLPMLAQLDPDLRRDGVREEKRQGVTAR